MGRSRAPVAQICDWAGGFPANAISALVAGHGVIRSPVRSDEAALGLRSRAKGAPDALRGGRHRQVGDAERGEGVEDRVHYRRCAGDRAAFADTFGAERGSWCWGRG